MIENRHFLLSHPRALLVLQGLTLVFFILILIPVLSGGKRQLLLMALLAGICALWMIQRPHWGVLIILTTWFIQTDDLAGTPYLVSAILLIPLGLSFLRDRGSWLLGVPQIQIFLIIGLLFLVSIWWSELKYPTTLFPEKDETRRQITLFVTRLVWLIFFLYFITTRQRIELAVWLALGLIVAAALSALPAFLASGGAKRAAATFSLARNSNRLAYICLFATSLVWFYRSFGQTQRWKLLTLPFLLFLPVTALTTGSRSGLLQMVTLAALVVKEQKGWSVTKRIYAIFVIGFIALLIFAIVPTIYLVRATSFDPQVHAPGQESLQHRIHVVFGALKMVASDPIFGAGIGNFTWVAPAFFGSGGNTHNSYLWALTSGGIGVFALYLLLFYITYRMLKQLETSGPQEFLWLSKGLRVNLLLFLIFTAFADFWLSDFLYLIVGLTIAMTHLWQRGEQKLALSRPLSQSRSII